MLRHWQYNMIVIQNTGAIEYSVSDSVEEKGTIVKKTASKYPSGQCVKS